MVTVAYIGFGVSVREYHIHNSGKKKVVGRHAVSAVPAPENRWGTLVYMNENGEKVEEKVPVGCAHYERIYDNLVDAIEHGAPKCMLLARKAFSMST